MRVEAFLLAALLAATLLPVGPLSAQEQEALPLADQVAAIILEYEDAQQAFAKAYYAAETPEEKQRVAEEGRPDAQEFASRLMALAETNPSDSGACEALVWVGQMGRGTERRAVAMSLLREHHLASPALGKFCASLAWDLSAESESFLRAVIASTSDDATRGKAQYALAKMMGQAARLCTSVETGEDTEALARYESRLGKEFVAALRKRGSAALEIESLSLLEIVAETCEGVSGRRGSLASLARSDLFEMRHLAVGKAAPEIEGQDVDGVAFKLSDYRGKVVLLDFWGDW